MHYYLAFRHVPTNMENIKVSIVDCPTPEDRELKVNALALLGQERIYNTLDSDLPFEKISKQIKRQFGSHIRSGIHLVIERIDLQ